LFLLGQSGNIARLAGKPANPFGGVGASGGLKKTPSSGPLKVYGKAIRSAAIVISFVHLKKLLPAAPKRLPDCRRK
jgi:hypothetical protein